MNFFKLPKTLRSYSFCLAIPIMGIALVDNGCDTEQSSDGIQQKQQERLLQEATAQVNMPAIKNFRERKMMKDILELRDQEGIITYTYLYSEQTGKLKFFGQTIGYGLPYSTQFTNPEKIAYASTNVGVANLPQADPNGLFSPGTAEGTWVLMCDPNDSKKTLPIYIEPRIIVSPFKLPPSVTE